jgi:hypothetical protein
MQRALATAVLIGLVGCGVSDRGTRCGIVALAGPTLLLEEFTKAGHTLGKIPDRMPEVVPVRLVAGQAQRGLVGRTDTSWVIGVDGPLQAQKAPGFGVLLVDPVQGARGVLLYEGFPIRGAPILGTVHLGSLVIPMIGLTTTVAGFEDGRCPLFPDSLRR